MDRRPNQLGHATAMQTGAKDAALSKFQQVHLRHVSDRGVDAYCGLGQVRQPNRVLLPMPAHIVPIMPLHIEIAASPVVIDAPHGELTQLPVGPQAGFCLPHCLGWTVMRGLLYSSTESVALHAMTWLRAPPVKDATEQLVMQNSLQHRVCKYRGVSCSCNLKLA